MVRVKLRQLALLAGALLLTCAVVTYRMRDAHVEVSSQDLLLITLNNTWEGPSPEIARLDREGFQDVNSWYLLRLPVALVPKYRAAVVRFGSTQEGWAVVRAESSIESREDTFGAPRWWRNHRIDDMFVVRLSISSNGGGGEIGGRLYEFSESEGIVRVHNFRS